MANVSSLVWINISVLYNDLTQASLCNRANQPGIQIFQETRTIKKYIYIKVKRKAIYT